MEIEMEKQEDEATRSKCYPEMADEAEYQKLVQNSELFLQKLKDFHSSFRTHFMFVLSLSFLFLFMHLISTVLTQFC